MTATDTNTNIQRQVQNQIENQNAAAALSTSASLANASHATTTCWQWRLMDGLVLTDQQPVDVLTAGLQAAGFPDHLAVRPRGGMGFRQLWLLSIDQWQPTGVPLFEHTQANLAIECTLIQTMDARAHTHLGHCITAIHADDATLALLAPRCAHWPMHAADIQWDRNPTTHRVRIDGSNRSAFHCTVGDTRPALPKHAAFASTADAQAFCTPQTLWHTPAPGSKAADTHENTNKRCECWAAHAPGLVLHPATCEQWQPTPTHAGPVSGWLQHPQPVWTQRLTCDQRFRFCPQPPPSAMAGHLQDQLVKHSDACPS